MRTYTIGRHTVYTEGLGLKGLHYASLISTPLRGSAQKKCYIYIYIYLYLYIYIGVYIYISLSLSPSLSLSLSLCMYRTSLWKTPKPNTEQTSKHKQEPFQSGALPKLALRFGSRVFRASGFSTHSRASGLGCSVSGFKGLRFSGFAVFRVRGSDRPHKSHNFENEFSNLDFLRPKP